MGSCEWLSRFATREKERDWVPSAQAEVSRAHLMFGARQEVGAVRLTTPSPFGVRVCESVGTGARHRREGPFNEIDRASPTARSPHRDAHQSGLEETESGLAGVQRRRAMGCVPHRDALLRGEGGMVTVVGRLDNSPPTEALPS